MQAREREKRGETGEEGLVSSRFFPLLRWLYIFFARDPLSERLEQARKTNKSV